MSLLGRLACLALFGVCLALVALPARALDPSALAPLAQDDIDGKIQAINALAARADPAVVPLLKALERGDLYSTQDGRFVIVTESGTIQDAISGEQLALSVDSLDKVMINNRVRSVIESALSALKLASPDREARLAAARALQDNPDPALLPLISRAAAREQDGKIRELLELAKAGIALKSPDARARLAAVRTLGESASGEVRGRLKALLEKGPDGSYTEPDAAVRAEAKKSIARIEQRLALGEYLGNAFSGVSLGSVLLLAALGLAITYGLMGVINMAHGELLMIGAYATYVVQNLFRSHWPELFDWYMLAAVPAAFAASALTGWALERSVIRHLYGRPLETLLATWGISLLLIQAVRTVFGPQNVEVQNPSWMSGGVQVLSNLVLPYNRIAIIAFALIVLLLTWALLNRTRLGLNVRAVTQNRTMAECVGVATGRIDAWAFSLGAGIAGLGGVALSQIGNVGPDLGQTYIVDSFMVVVLGGVGQLAGTVAGAWGLGVVNKLLEPYAGAVLGKIAVLAFIIFFIQKRPQGLFALKGRMAEA